MKLSILRYALRVDHILWSRLQSGIGLVVGMQKDKYETVTNGIKRSNIGGFITHLTKTEYRVAWVYTHNRPPKKG